MSERPHQEPSGLLVLIHYPDCYKYPFHCSPIITIGSLALVSFVSSFSSFSLGHRSSSRQVFYSFYERTRSRSSTQPISSLMTLAPPSSRKKSAIVIAPIEGADSDDQYLPFLSLLSEAICPACSSQPEKYFEDGTISSGFPRGSLAPSILNNKFKTKHLQKLLV